MIQLFFNEISLSIGLSPHLEFPNCRINPIVLEWMIIILEYPYSEFPVLSWHFQLDLIELTLQIYYSFQLQLE